MSRETSQKHKLKPKPRTKRRKQTAKAKTPPKAKTPRKANDCQEAEEQQEYQVRSIIDEKRLKGKLLYKIDWADDPHTGQSYEPTWEPAEYANELAVADWNNRKRLRQLAELDSLSSSIESDPQATPRANAGTKRRRSLPLPDEDTRSSKRTRVSRNSEGASTAVNSQEWAFASPPQTKDRLVVALPAAPGIDTADYVPVSVSQPSSQEELDSLDKSSLVEVAALAVEKVSQTTIPDSQGLTESLQSQHTAATDFLLPGALATDKVDIPERQARSPVSHSEGGDTYSSASEPTVITPVGHAAEGNYDLRSDQPSSIKSPEHQPDRSVADIPSQQLSSPHQDSQPDSELLREQLENSRSQSSYGLPPLKLTPPAASQIPSSPVFLTQPEFDFETSQVDETSPPRQAFPSVPSQGREKASDDQDSETNHTAIGVPAILIQEGPTSSPHHSHFAQIVSPLSSDHENIQFQSQETGNTEETGIVPETAHKHPIQTAPSRRLAEASGKECDRIVSEAASDTASSVGSPLGDRALRQSSSSSVSSFHTGIEKSRSRSITPRKTIRKTRMDAPPIDEGHSAVDVFKQLAANHYPELGISPDRDLSSHDPSTAPVPGTVIDGRTTTSYDIFRQALMEQCPDTYSAAVRANPQDFGPPGRNEMSYEQIPATVAPSDLDVSASRVSIAHDDFLPENHALLDEDSGDHLEVSLRNVASNTIPLEEDSEESDDEKGHNEFILTLPMAANTRPQYLSMIDENKEIIVEYGKVFSTSLDTLPSETLVASMSFLFQRLLDLCDLPAYAESLPLMSQEEMMKHATGSNSKFSFVYEFLNGIRDLNTRVLVLSRPGRTFDYLEAVVSASSFRFSVLGREDPGAENGLGDLEVILSTPDQDLSGLSPVEVVVYFDHASRSVSLPKNLVYEDGSTLLLTLVIHNSLEHIDYQLGPEPRGLERKNALSLITAVTKDSLASPEEGLPEPHELAEMFSSFLRDPVIGIDYEHHSIPEEAFDIWKSSQQRRTQETGHDSLAAQNSRKRALDGSEIGTPKRARVMDSSLPLRYSTPAQMTDLLKDTLASHKTPGSASTEYVEVSVDQLESMAAKIAKLEADLEKKDLIGNRLRTSARNSEDQVKSMERTINTLHPRFMEALQDRKQFEKACKEAQEEASSAKKQLEKTKSELEALKTRTKDLETKLADARTAMASSEDKPELARRTQLEQQLAEAEARAQKAEKKAAEAENTSNYAREAYQNASNAHSQLNAENKQLKEEIKVLQRTANENIVRINQINHDNEHEALTAQTQELRATLRDRERDLNFAREELGRLKSGRRETRQASVPRSPRTSTMSPRLPAGRSTNNGGGGGHPASSSRGTSPAPVPLDNGGGQIPGLTFAANNNRWGHLRD